MICSQSLKSWFVAPCLNPAYPSELTFGTSACFLRLYKNACTKLQRPHPATPEQMTRFHTDEYIHFLKRVTPETAGELSDNGTRCTNLFSIRFGLLINLFFLQTSPTLVTTTHRTKARSNSAPYPLADPYLVPNGFLKERLTLRSTGLEDFITPKKAARVVSAISTTSYLEFSNSCARFLECYTSTSTATTEMP